MKLIDKDALVAEIERQQRRLDILGQSNEVELRKNAVIQNGAYCSLLSFINRMSEEPSSDDLEEEIDNWLDDGLPNEDELVEHIKETARHFAKWQKTQMMNEAVATTIDNTPLNGALGICLHVNTSIYNKGDKVKLIIVKDD